MATEQNLDLPDAWFASFFRLKTVTTKAVMFPFSSVLCGQGVWRTIEEMTRTDTWYEQRTREGDEDAPWECPFKFQDWNCLALSFFSPWPLAPSPPILYHLNCVWASTTILTWCWLLIFLNVRNGSPSQSQHYEVLEHECTQRSGSRIWKEDFFIDNDFCIYNDDWDRCWSSA